MITDEDTIHLNECIKLAKDNPDKVSPTSLGVGCIIVNRGQIVGKGTRFTRVLQQNPYKDITYHAEHCAITEAGPLCDGATLYCTMEPCAKRREYEHPYPDDCCSLIKKSKIKRVVYAYPDEGFGKGGKEKLLKWRVEVDQVVHS